uniref:RdRp n=1 Tax=Hubei partiti-like virus 16 TaxID=1923022 RepID=A0A1L3KLL4_9VIRU|nr:RdRp [Hubei partiti-like virus 16]
MPFKELSLGGGFSANYQLPTPDPIALKYLTKWFGSGNVGLITKKYHRAKVNLERLSDDILEYDRTYTSRIKDPSYDAIYMSVLKDFTPDEPIIPLTNGAIYTDSRTPRSSAAGFPYSGMTKGEIFDNPEITKSITSDWQAVGSGYPIKFPDTKVFFRAQICDPEKHKIRGTWGYPVSMFCEEARFVYPYLDWLKTRTDEYPLAYGLEMANGGMEYINRMSNLVPNSTYIMLDWSKFDKTVPAWLIRDAFSIIIHGFDLSHVKDSEGIIWEVDPSKTKRRIQKFIKYFINTPFQLSDGRRYMKDGGIPSGSAWTNLIDTVVNCLVTRYCFYHTFGGYWISDLFLGDDGFIVAYGPINLDKMAQFARTCFGMELNLDKSYQTSNPINIKFLGFNNFQGKPGRSQDFLIASLLFPERFYGDPDPGFTCVRALGQLWSTLNPAQAMPWYRIVLDIQQDYNIDVLNTLQELSKRKMFKFLLTLGFTLDELTLPEVVNGVIPAVMPKSGCARAPKVYHGDLSSLYNQLQDIDIWYPM